MSSKTQPKHITGTHIAYLHLCHRKLWLFAHGLNMEQQSDLVTEGRLIQEHSYPQRAERWQEIAVEGIRIDHFDAVHGILREVKKSNKREVAHVAQVKYYLFVLRRNGIPVDHAVLEYPRLRKTEEIRLNEADLQAIPQWEAEARQIIAQTSCPQLIQKSLCKRCAYYSFCYA
jgi:CRISPR-associated exonuclease Cas4